MNHKAVVRKAEGNRIAFFCVGCDEYHMVTLKPDGPWTWNNDTIDTTIDPSVLVRSGHYANPKKDQCWCTYNESHPNNPSPFSCRRCHCFVRKGKIIYLSDSTHNLAGQTIEMIPVE